MKNIILIGFMGVGKGTVSREIVKHSGVVALDTDDVIESMENRRIKKIFAIEGEAYFRDLERRVATWLSHSVRDTLISTGGGFYKVPNLNLIGKVVYLYSDFDSIYERILNHPNAQRKLKKRPLFKELDKAKELFNERAPEYEKVADITIDVRNKNAEQIAQEIIKKAMK
ncbi:MAG: shikimate kinase [Campylobacterota bacterium]|nr:shikimate kinase [Campylobacterota bacterium]